MIAVPKRTLEMMFPWLRSSDERPASDVSHAQKSVRPTIKEADYKGGPHRRRLCVAFMVLLGVACPVVANHWAGGNITYSHLGAGQYSVNLALFRDCQGPFVNPQQQVTFTGAGGTTFTMLLNQSGGVQPATVPCAQLLSSCNGGTGPGMQRFNFTGVVALPAAGMPWTIGWTDQSSCCRNQAILNLQNPNGTSMYFESRVMQAGNSSSTAATASVPYVCANQAVSFNLGCADPNGDQLTYALVAALQAPATPVLYAPPFTAPSPIPGIALDPVTGQINFTPNLVGNFVVTVRVREFDGFGQLVGQVVHDLQFVVLPCTNQVPSAPSGSTISSGSAIPQGGNTYVVCAGEDLSLTIPFPDPDAVDTLTLASNAASVLVGAVFNTTGVNPAIAQVDWATAYMTSGTYTFTVLATDNGCPIANQTSISITVIVDPALSVLAFADTAVCALQPAYIGATASGGTGTIDLAWSNGLTGSGPLTIWPDSTEAHAVICTDAYGCQAFDIMNVFVHPLPNTTFNASDLDPCFGDTLQFTAVTDPSTVASALWSFGNGSISDSFPSTTHLYGISDCFPVSLTLTNTFGCVDSSSAPVLVCVHPNPEADFSFGPQPTDVLWPHILFEDQTNNTTDSLLWLWSFGVDGNLGSGVVQNPSFTFPDGGPSEYPVLLTVWNQYGCWDTLTQWVVIDGVTQLFIPNAFTPNGDAINDVWSFAAEGVHDFELSLFDRWGNPIWSTSDPNAHFDGGDLPVGVYSWRCRYRSTYSTDVRVSLGTVTLIR